MGSNGFNRILTGLYLFSPVGVRLVPLKTHDREEHSMDRCRCRPERFWEIWEPLVHMNFRESSYGPMALWPCYQGNSYGPMALRLFFLGQRRDLQARFLTPLSCLPLKTTLIFWTWFLSTQNLATRHWGYYYVIFWLGASIIHGLVYKCWCGLPTILTNRTHTCLDALTTTKIYFWFLVCSRLQSSTRGSAVPCRDEMCERHVTPENMCPKLAGQIKSGKNRTKFGRSSGKNRVKPLFFFGLLPECCPIFARISPEPRPNPARISPKFYPFFAQMFWRPFLEAAAWAQPVWTSLDRQCR